MTRWVVGFAVALGCAVAAHPSWPAALAAAAVAALAGYLHRENMADARSQRADAALVAAVRDLAEAATKDRAALTALTDKVQRHELLLPQANGGRR